MVTKESESGRIMYVRAAASIGPAGCPDHDKPYKNRTHWFVSWAKVWHAQ